jgi:hypothetical protein
MPPAARHLQDSQDLQDLQGLQGLQDPSQHRGRLPRPGWRRSAARASWRGSFRCLHSAEPIASSVHARCSVTVGRLAPHPLRRLEERCARFKRIVRACAAAPTTRGRHTRMRHSPRRPYYDIHALGRNPSVSKGEGGRGRGRGREKESRKIGEREGEREGSSLVCQSSARALRLPARGKGTLRPGHGGGANRA